MVVVVCVEGAGGAGAHGGRCDVGGGRGPVCEGRVGAGKWRCVMVVVVVCACMCACVEGGGAEGRG